MGGRTACSKVRAVRGILAVALAAAIAAASAAGGEAPGRVIPDGKTSKGGDMALFFNTRTLLVEGLAVQWGCKSVAAGKPSYDILTHKGIGKIPANHHLSLSVLLPYTEIGRSKALGKAKVTVSAALAWGPESTTSIRRVTAKGTVAVQTGSCSSGTMTFTAREH